MKEKYTPASTHFLEGSDVCTRKWKVKEGSHTLAPAPLFYYFCLCQWDGCRMWHLNSGLNRRFGRRRSREGKSAPVSLCLSSKSPNKRHNSVTGTLESSEVLRFCQLLQRRLLRPITLRRSYQILSLSMTFWCFFRVFIYFWGSTHFESQTLQPDHHLVST